MSLHVIIMSVLKGIIIRQVKNKDKYNLKSPIFKDIIASVLSEKSPTLM